MHNNAIDTGAGIYETLSKSGNIIVVTKPATQSWDNARADGLNEGEEPNMSGGCGSGRQTRKCKG